MYKTEDNHDSIAFLSSKSGKTGRNISLLLV